VEGLRKGRNKVCRRESEGVTVGDRNDARAYRVTRDSQVDPVTNERTMTSLIKVYNEHWLLL